MQSRLLPLYSREAFGAGIFLIALVSAWILKPLFGLSCCSISATISIACWFLLWQSLRGAWFVSCRNTDLVIAIAYDIKGKAIYLEVVDDFISALQRHRIWSYANIRFIDPSIIRNRDDAIKYSRRCGKVLVLYGHTSTGTQDDKPVTRFFIDCCCERSFSQVPLEERCRKYLESLSRHSPYPVQASQSLYDKRALIDDLMKTIPMLLGFILRDKKRDEDALNCFNEAINYIRDSANGSRLPYTIDTEIQEEAKKHAVTCCRALGNAAQGKGQGNPLTFKPDISKAIIFLDFGLRYGPSITIYSALARLYFESGEFDKSRQIVKKMAEVAPDNVMTLLAGALWAMHDGNFNKSYALLRSAGIENWHERLIVDIYGLCLEIVEDEGKVEFLFVAGLIEKRGNLEWDFDLLWEFLDRADPVMHSVLIKFAKQELQLVA